MQPVTFLWLDLLVPMSVQGRIKIGYRRNQTHGDGIDIGPSEQFAINDVIEQQLGYFASEIQIRHRAPVIV
jgi:hypothetical protein